MIRFVLLIFIFFWNTVLFAQNITSENEQIDAIYSSKESNAIKTAKMKAFIETEIKLLDTITLSKAYHKLGLLFYKNSNYKKAIAITEKAVELRSSLDTIDYYKLNNSLFNINFYYKFLDDKLNRKEVLYKLIQQPEKNKFTYKAYIDLGYLVSENGDYYKAIAYFKNVINSFDNYKDVNTLLYAHKASIYVYSEIDETKRNLEVIQYHQQKINELVAAYGFSKDPAVNNNLGNIYEDFALQEKAINEYQEALNIYLKNNDLLNTSQLYNNIGRIYSKLKEADKANEYFNKGLAITQSQKVKASIYSNKASFLEDDKIKFYQKAIHTLLGREYENVLPNFEDIQKSVYRLDVLDNLVNIFEVTITNYEVEKQTQLLNKATALSLLIDKLLSSIRLESEVDMSKLFWIRKASRFYMSAVKTCYFKNDVDQAFYFMEKNKSLLLLESLKKEETKIINSLAIVSLNDAISTHITSERNLLAYILNDEEGYGIFCSKNEKLFFKLAEVPTLLQDIDVLKEKMTQYFVNIDDKETYNTIANAVFKKILPFKNAMNSVKGKQLIIIPDYKLQYINFEALITNIATARYLFEDAEISYFLSASVSHQLQSKNKEKIKTKVLGFAPVEFKIDGLLPLKRSETIMQEIKDIYPSDIYLKEAATKELFEQKIKEYTIIHINSHAGITDNTGEPWLAFYEQKIDLKEISELQNKAAIVVLDACKGASGKQEIGEGIMSLARGFFRGGAKSVLTNQWNANEKATNEILINFYKELKKGNTKSKALYNAKKKYLATHQLSEVSPYYWASLILIGDYNTLENTNGIKNIWFWFLGSCMFIFLFFTKKKRLI